MSQPTIIPHATYYRYWREVPAHLWSRKRLRVAGLRPGGLALAWTQADWGPCYLYDHATAVPLHKATPAQAAALARGARHPASAAHRGISGGDRC